MTNLIKKNKNGFTLIEILAIIVILAIIALIAVPNISGYVKRSKDQSFRTSIDSLIHSYEYENLEDDDIGRVTPCVLDTNKCNMEGYIEKDDAGRIVVYLTDGNKCAVGYSGSYQIKNGDCTREVSNPPLITSIVISNLTVTSANVFVNFTEEEIVTSAKFRLKDSNGNLVYDWKNADSLNTESEEKVAKKIYTGLEQGKTYTVEVEIKNNSEEDNTAVSTKTFATLNVTGPEITYSKTWEKSKVVTITYSSSEGVSNQYRTRTDNLFDLTGWKQIDGGSTTITVNNYHYYVDAKSTINGTSVSSSNQIGYVDNENDSNNTKPSIEVSDYKNDNGINTDQINLEMSDTLSGVGSYCISTVNDYNNCVSTETNTNKWISVASRAEIREKTVQHTMSGSGTYYAFLKDYVGNVSDSKPFTVYTIHYDLNGGTGTVNDQIKLKGYTLTLTNQVPTKTGYEFLGWSTDKTSHTGTYSSSGTYTTDSNLVLYAIWRKEVVITYNENSGTGTIPTVSTCYKYNNDASCEITFKTTSLTRTGYTFKGWALGRNTAVTYNAGTKYNITDSVMVYAAWKTNDLAFSNQSFTKTFDLNTQTITITGASNGTGSYTYSEVSEVNSSSTATSYITIASNGTITLSASTPAGVYTYVVKATSNVSNNVDNYTTVTKNATMTITVNAYNLSNATIADISAYTYTGTERKPTPAVTALGTTLTSGTDFTYSYSNNKNAGTATVTVTGKGNYTGTKSKNFTINPAGGQSNSITCATLTYNGANQSLISSTHISNAVVYYKVGTELTSSNYTTGSTTKPTAKDAGTYVVYFYAPADNFVEAKGSATCTISAKSIAVSWANTSLPYNGSKRGPTASVSTGISGETMTLTISGLEANAGSHVATASCASVTTNNKCTNYTLTNTSTNYTITKINPTMNLSSTSGTLNVGTNGTITVSGSNYGTLSCTSSNTSVATCSVSGTTVTMVPKAVGTATITVKGAGNANYNAINKTYALTVQAGWYCDSGTLTYDASRGASSGNYICTTTANASTYKNCTRTNTSFSSTCTYLGSISYSSSYYLHTCDETGLTNTYTVYYNTTNCAIKGKNVNCNVRYLQYLNDGCSENYGNSYYHFGESYTSYSCSNTSIFTNCSNWYISCPTGFTSSYTNGSGNPVCYKPALDPAKQWTCSSGTRIEDSNKGATTGGYVCVATNATLTGGGRTCSGSIYCPHYSKGNCGRHGCSSTDPSTNGYGINDYESCYTNDDTLCAANGGSVPGQGWSCCIMYCDQELACSTGWETVQPTYQCPSGWSYYDGGAYSANMRCYMLPTMQ